MTRKIMRRFFIAVSLLLAFASVSGAAEVTVEGASELPFVPDRRKPQWTTDFGYALFPYPYSLPGLGSGISLVGGAMNIADTYTDAYGIVFTGQVRGAAAGIADIHLIPRTLIIDAGFGTINEATIQSYAQRGMNLPARMAASIVLGREALHDMPEATAWILGAFVHRLDGQALVVLAAQHDNRHLRRPGMQLNESIQALAVGQAVTVIAWLSFHSPGLPQ